MAKACVRGMFLFTDTGIVTDRQRGAMRSMLLGLQHALSCGTGKRDTAKRYNTVQRKTLGEYTKQLLQATDNNNNNNSNNIKHVYI